MSWEKENNSDEEEKKYKFLIKFENDIFQFQDIVRVEFEEVFDEEKEDIRYCLTIHTQTGGNQFSKTYKYLEEEFGLEKKEEFENKLLKMKAIIV